MDRYIISYLSISLLTLSSFPFRNIVLTFYIPTWIQRCCLITTQCLCFPPCQMRCPWHCYLFCYEHIMTSHVTIMSHVTVTSHVSIMAHITMTSHVIMMPQVTRTLHITMKSHVTINVTMSLWRHVPLWHLHGVTKTSRTTRTSCTTLRSKSGFKHVSPVQSILSINYLYSFSYILLVINGINF